MTPPATRSVLFPMLGLGPSGGVRMICALANELATRGVNVSILAPVYGGSPPIPLHDGVHLELVEAHRRAAFWRIAISRTHRFDGTIVATGYLTPLLIFAAAPSGPVFYLIQGAEVESHVRFGPRNPVAKAILERAARFGYRVPASRIAVSNFVARSVGAGGVSAVVSPGIADAFIAAIPADGAIRPRNALFTVGCLPAAGHAKGADILVQAMDSLRQRNVAFRALVFDRDNGPGPFAAVAERFSTCAASGNGDLLAFYRICDAFVYPSRVEGFGLPPLEAMAGGAAVVLTDCGGPADYAQHRHNALVVPTNDADAMAVALASLAGDEALRQHLVRSGYTTARRFPQSRFVSRCADIILGGKAVRATLLG